MSPPSSASQARSPRGMAKAFRAKSGALSQRQAVLARFSRLLSPPDTFWRGDIVQVKRAIENFLSHCRYEKNLSPKTLSAYGTDLKQFQAFLKTRARVANVKKVDKEVLRAYIRTLFAGSAEKTVKRKVATLKALFGFLERDDVIAVNPFRKMQVRIKETRRLPRMVSLEDLTRLYLYLYRLEVQWEAKQGDSYRVLVRDIAVLEVLFGTGARISEICHLRPTDVDLRRGSIRILGKGGRERMVPICGGEALNALRAYRSLWAIEIEEAGYFFQGRRGARLSEQSVRGSLRTYALRAGIACRVTPHMIRHSVATLLLEEGVDIRYIQNLLGHSSIMTTQIYVHARDHRQWQVLAKRHPRRHLSVIK
jgi:integrase/recombinase XerD